MADVSIIVDKSGTEFTIADAPARANIAEIAENVGNLENLTTTAKNNIVAALNEVDGHAKPEINTVSGETTIKAAGLIFKTFRLLNFDSREVSFKVPFPTACVSLQIQDDSGGYSSSAVREQFLISTRSVSRTGFYSHTFGITANGNIPDAVVPQITVLAIGY